MTKCRSELSALLIQIRKDPNVKLEELESFASYARLKKDQFKILDVFSQSFPAKEDLKKYDCVFIGGASEASVSSPEVYTFVPNLISCIKDLLSLKLPTFASCFGFQAAILALGGKVYKDEKDFEMGTLPITITKDALNDPVYKNTPDGFYAVSVHQEKAIDLPKNCTLLAFTDACIHSFKVNDLPFWAFQFHPELDLKCLTQRLSVYQEKYTDDVDHFSEIINSLRPTPYSNKLVENFIDSILLQK